MRVRISDCEPPLLFRGGLTPATHLSQGRALACGSPRAERPLLLCSLSNSALWVFFVFFFNEKFLCKIADKLFEADAWISSCRITSRAPGKQQRQEARRHLCAGGSRAPVQVQQLGLTRAQEQGRGTCQPGIWTSL